MDNNLYIEAGWYELSYKFPEYMLYCQNNKIQLVAAQSSWLLVAFVEFPRETNTNLVDQSCRYIRQMHYSIDDQFHKRQTKHRMNKSPRTLLSTVPPNFYHDVSDLKE